MDGDRRIATPERNRFIMKLVFFVAFRGNPPQELSCPRACRRKRKSIFIVHCPRRFFSPTRDSCTPTAPTGFRRVGNSKPPTNLFTNHHGFQFPSRLVRKTAMKVAPIFIYGNESVAQSISISERCSSQATFAYNGSDYCDVWHVLWKRFAILAATSQCTLRWVMPGLDCRYRRNILFDLALSAFVSNNRNEKLLIRPSRRNTFDKSCARTQCRRQSAKETTCWWSLTHFRLKCDRSNPKMGISGWFAYLLHVLWFSSSRPPPESCKEENAELISIQSRY